jgi:hypothetical protein
MAELLAWAGTRVLHWRIALLWLLVLAATFAAGPLVAAGWTLAITAALIVQFRLWDDLEDLPHDRVHAPQRVLVQCTRLRPFRLVFAASVGVVAVAFALLQGWPRVAAYLLLLAAMATLYRTTGDIGARRTLRTQLVLLKYAAFVLLLADDPVAPRALAAALALHATLAVHEWNDQRTAPPP